MTALQQILQSYLIKKMNKYGSDDNLVIAVFLAG